MDRRELEEIKAYIRWHDNDRTIAQIKRQFGISSQTVKDIYDLMFDGKKGLMPKSKFYKPLPDGITYCGRSPRERSYKSASIEGRIENCVVTEYANGMDEEIVMRRWGLTKKAFDAIVTKNRRVIPRKYTATERILTEVNSGEWLSTRDISMRTGYTERTCSIIIGELKRSGCVDWRWKNKTKIWKVCFANAG